MKSKKFYYVLHSDFGVLAEMYSKLEDAYYRAGRILERISEEFIIHVDERGGWGQGHEYYFKGWTLINKYIPGHYFHLNIEAVILDRPAND